MTKIIIRCDASTSIGTGHVIRCRTLARQLQLRGADITFLCRRQPGDLIALLEREFYVIALPVLPLSPCDGLEGRDLYGVWLGCTQEQDAAQCLQALAEAGIKSASCLVTDHYGLDAIWEGQLLKGLAGRDAPPMLLVIDDLADRLHQADLLLDQNFFGEGSEHRYRGLVPPQCHQLHGPHYALLGPEYAQLHPLMPLRTELRRLLVYFGGGDPCNLTAQTLEALLETRMTDLAVDVVLGLQSPHRLAVEKFVAIRPNTTLHAPTESLAGLIARADLAIGAVGTTTWERACLGLPCISVPVASNQIPVSKMLARHNYIRLIEFSSEAFPDKLLDEVDSFFVSSYIESASLACRTLTRGDGAQICTDHLLNSRTQSFP